ncbi:MAG TPA: TonB family protein [Lamprocystis sp. (in: g-proteobacteria)]|nr:TonB family protein [Lamprocystis sp. (in: g-proteobacteria)]
MTEPANDQILPQALTAALSRGPSQALQAAFAVAVSLHLILIFLVSFTMPQPTAPPPAGSLEVLILKDAGESTQNPEPDAALSQRSRVGDSPLGDGVNSAADDLEPLPEGVSAEIVPTLEPPVEPIAAPPPAPEPPPAALTAAPRTKPERTVRTLPPVTPPPAVEPSRPVDAAQILNSRNQEIARLTESLEARSAAYASRQRRKSIDASTREYRYASYLGAWARKVERIGNLNYPQAAKEQHLYGNLILDVAILADGSVQQIRIVQSSGYPLLDQAAIRIVELAAPFSPFPPDIAAETDVLDVVRTWQFLRGGKLGWE